MCGAPRPEVPGAGAAGESPGGPRRARRGAVRSSLPLFPSRSARGPGPPEPRKRPAGSKHSAASKPDPVEAVLDFEAEHAAGRDAGAAEPGSAGLIRRIAAAVIDAGILLAMDAAVVVLTLRAAALPFTDLATLPLLPLGAFLVLLDAGYLTAFLMLAGQTVGEMVAGVPVRVAGEAR